MTRSEYMFIDTYEDGMVWELFLRHWPFLKEIHRWPFTDGFPSQMISNQASLVFSFIYAYKFQSRANNTTSNARENLEFGRILVSVSATLYSHQTPMYW